MYIGVEFLDTTSQKKSFRFARNCRESLKKNKVGSSTRIVVEDEQGKATEFSFRVTRNVRLGNKTHWIYGQILGTPENEYYQIELKLHEEEPNTDTVEVFLQAPPFMIDELR